MSLESDVTSASEEERQKKLEETAQEFINLVLNHRNREARDYLGRLDEETREKVKKYIRTTPYKWTLKATSSVF